MASGMRLNTCLRRATQLIAGPSNTSATRITARQISISFKIQQEEKVNQTYSNQSSPLTTTSTKPQEPKKHDLPSPFEPAKYHPRTHYHHVATLQLQCYGHGKDVEKLDSFANFAIRAGYALGIPLSAVHSLPTTKSLWTVPRGPFVHKKSQENFERRTNKRMIKVWDADLEVVNKWLQFLRIHSMASVGMRVEVFRHVPVGFGKQMLAASTAQLRSAAIDNADDTTLRSSQADREKVELLARNIVKEELAQEAEHDIQNADEKVAIEGQTEPKKD